ncbi:hypothetical protein BS17DRAFT_852177 [Gyrodon lividus]|nr:hypothetical protein BS17DRAFT_852177 [Gyrodon lividus]
MPTSTLNTALLALGSHNGLPWMSEAWQGLTHVHGIPWEHDVNAADDSVAPNHRQWNVHTAKMVETFANNLWAKDEDQQDAFMLARTADNDSAGRTTWHKFIKDTKLSSSLNKVIDQCLTENNCNPYQVTKQHGQRLLPMLEEAQAMDICMDLVEQLLGEDAYVDGRKALTKPVSKFINTLMTISWNQFRKVVITEVPKMDKLVEVIKTELARISVEGYKPSTAELLALLKNIRTATTLLQLEGLLAAVQKDTSSEAAKKLPKSVVNALSQLASADEIAAITIIIHASLENLNVNITEKVIIKVDKNIDISNWSKGVEDLNMLTTDELWERLGLPQKQLLFFQEWSNPDLVVDTWMLEWVFEDKPLLLMDGVGLGKTLQAVRAIACMAYYWECFRTKGTFPGHFMGCRMNTPDGNIPNLPHIIICPVNLRNQWEYEIKRFLKLASFDLFPYVGHCNKRKNWWFEKSIQQNSQCIILATYMKGESQGKHLKLGKYEHNSQLMVYGREFGMMIMDEAHTGCKYNFAHVTCHELCSRSKVLMALTATPVTMKPQDLWIMGDLLSIKGFQD